MRESAHGIVIRKRRSCTRESLRRKTTDPSAPAPCTWNTFLAKSSPMMLTSPLGALLYSGVSTPATLAHRCRRGASTPSLTHISRLGLNRCAINVLVKTAEVDGELEDEQVEASHAERENLLCGLLVENVNRH